MPSRGAPRGGGARWWSYEDSVSRVKQVIYKWGKMTQELLKGGIN